MSFNVNLTSLKPSSRATRLTFTTTSQLPLVLNAFNRIINKGKGPSLMLRDSCLRLTLAYNSNYNLYVTLCKDITSGYSPYVFKEPLFDDRPIIVVQLPKHCVLAPPAKRPRTSWVWPLGYTITDSSRSRNPMLMWHCKLCKY